jgi:hypothetical protein
LSRTDRDVNIGASRRILNLDALPPGVTIRGWDCHPDGKRAVVCFVDASSLAGRRPSLSVIANWEQSVIDKLRPR